VGARAAPRLDGRVEGRVEGVEVASGSVIEAVPVASLVGGGDTSLSVEPSVVSWAVSVFEAAVVVVEAAVVVIHMSKPRVAFDTHLMSAGG
jgi:hypothetical protein